MGYKQVEQVFISPVISCVKRSLTSQDELKMLNSNLATVTQRRTVRYHCLIVMLFMLSPY